MTESSVLKLSESQPATRQFAFQHKFAGLRRAVWLASEGGARDDTGTGRA